MRERAHGIHETDKNIWQNHKDLIHLACAFRCDDKRKKICYLQRLGYKFPGFT
jgi:hypothetical protein